MPRGKPRKEEDSLEFLYPDLVKEWHPTKNQFSPRDIKPNTCKPACWICPNGHEWVSPIFHRTKWSRSCPQCSRLAKKPLSVRNPKLSQEWHPTKNKQVTPDQVWPNSTKKVWWKCQKGHEWEAKISNRNQGTGCPICKKRKIEENSLEIINPKLAQEWHPIKNGHLTPRDVTPKSNEKVWWRCRNGHEWKEPILNRLKKNTGCPICRLALPPLEICLLTTHPELANEWDSEKNRLTSRLVTADSLDVVWWKCNNGHSWRAIIKMRAEGLGCPQCNK